MKACLRLAAFGALLVAAGVPANAADRVVQVRPGQAGPGIDAFPQIVDPVDDAERRINAAVKRLDAQVRKAAKSCKAEGGAQSSWERSIRAAMRGPRFLSFAIHDSTFCGGAHPNTGTTAIVYDLTTGTPVDWTTLLPPALTGKVALATQADETKMVTLSSKRLHALYLQAYRPKTGKPKADADDKECREAVTETYSGEPPAMTVWPDAEAGGLAVQFDLAHVVQACADTVVIPTATLRREGVQAVLTDAIDAAHAKRP
ncbi:hypothetical protein [Methylobacterium pseudosasicola]|uniref:Secreted protein n=1 Tax=Methylobacterium pseudosasicola TaxID=582667 RepID=A0A1I4PGI6_9HYPH|nr:hypothetical protein [Methylobacterium pseudosasicola]SFM26922.1 hypothetical protein SAMN05192568_102496 [Methylobacterium pseudosasicola]